MSGQRTDVIELLMPAESSARRARARSWTALMRLLIDDSRSRECGRVSVSLESASSALERHVREELRGLLVELLRVFLTARLEGTESGAWLLPGGGSGVPAACWGALEQYRAERPWLASVPAPNEDALAVAERLQASLEQLIPVELSGRTEVELWRARVLFAAGDPKRALAHLEQQLEAATEVGQRIPLVACLVELLLERGAVLRAVAILEEHRALSLADPSLLELRAITALLLGRRSEVASIRPLLAPSTRRRPPALAALAASAPEWAELLPASASSEASTGALEARALSRQDLGAALLAVFRPVIGRAAALVSSDVSPGWRRRLEPWLSSKAAGCDSLEPLEQELVATARPLVLHRSELEELRGSLGGDDARALALCPILDAHGEASAWLYLEFEHHLVPSERSLAALAKGWGRELANELGGDCGTDPGKSGSAGELARREGGGRALGAPADAEDPRAQFFRAFASELAMKTARRQWWGFALSHGEPAWMAAGGGSLRDALERPGGAQALSRIRRCGVPIRFDAPDPALSIHAEAGSGVVIPFAISGRAVGCFALESERRRDFRPDDLQRLNELARRWSPRLQVARFRAWHLEAFGLDLFFDVESKGFGRRALDFALAGRVNEPVVLSGPAGSGKEVLARWLHYERAEGAGELEVVRCEATPEGELEALLDGATGRDASVEASELKTLVIKDVLALGGRLQGLLLRLLETPAPGLRVIVTLAVPLEEAAARGQLLAALAHRLSRLELFVPPLADRRGELPGLIELATRRFAVEFGVQAPTWEDAAIGLLWRQPWTGNLRELESLIYKLVLLHPGERLEVSHVRRVAKRFRFDLQKKLPSRHPRLADLLVALRVTRKQSGNTNKTRAALYLGWDPDTLVARLRDAGLDPSGSALEVSQAGELFPADRSEQDPEGKGKGST